jgi:MoxR-like ATPase
MFNIVLDYPTYEEELEVIKSTTTNQKIILEKILTANDIIHFQQLVRQVPVADNVLEYAVKLVNKTRPSTQYATTSINEFVSYGAGPRAGQYLILGAKCHALINGKYSPDIENVKAVAIKVLRHRLIKNYKAEAEGVSIEKIIEDIM